MSVYLDHAATTPVRASALRAFNEATHLGGNPSSVHAAGRLARRSLEESRESIAGNLGVRPNEVIFTSGGTEADNLGVKGTYLALRRRRPKATAVLTSATEHHAVLDSVQSLVGTAGAVIETIPVSSDGVVDLGWLANRLHRAPESVALVTVMAANNETGVVAPLPEISQLCAETGVPLHCDAVQFVGWQPLLGDWLAGSTTVALSGHKFGAPAGIGALVLHEIAPATISHGGGQELKIRSGTVPVALAAAMAAALTECCSARVTESVRIAAIRDQLEAGVSAAGMDGVINGGAACRLPNISSVTLPDANADAVLMMLDSAGISASAGSACTAGVSRPSHVIEAMLGSDAAGTTVRFSLGWSTSVSDIDSALAALPAAVAAARRLPTKSGVR